MSMVWLMCLMVTFQFAPLEAWSQDERARIQIDYFARNDSIHELAATVKTKEESSYVNVPGVPVQFYIGEMNAGNELGTEVTGKNGRAVVTIPRALLDTLPKYTFIAAISDHERFRDYSRDLEITPATMAVDFTEDEGAYNITVRVTARDSSGQWTPVSGADIKVYVQRLFGELPVSVDFNVTGEDGEVAIAFPDDIPGDPEGKIGIIVKIPDHTHFGNLVHREIRAWGMPGQTERAEIDGELWSARMNAPMYLIVIVNSMLLGIWGVIVYIIVNLFKIRKLGHTGETV